MFELLHKKIEAIIPITEEQFNFCTSLFLPKNLRKRQYFLQGGEPSKYQAFVAKGMLRSYTIDEKGVEHILQFASEGWWMADLSSYLTGEPSLFNIECLEDSELLLITKASWEQLMQTIPAFEHYFRIIIQNHLVATEKRLMQSLTETAETKYVKFIETYPECLQRVPQHMIASYLGITRETLSRLRKQMTIRNGNG